MSVRGSPQTTVLIVEDEPEVGAAYEKTLEREFDVRRVEDGTTALSAVKNCVDVILLDRDIPELHGDEVARELRDRGEDVPIAMVTAVEPDGEIIDLPVDEYLTKPVSSETLHRTVSVLANRSTFTDKSREFFQLAAKEASLAATDSSEATRQELHQRLSELKTELDEIVTVIDRPDEGVTPDRELEAAEVESLLEGVYDHPLPDELRELVEAYQALDAARPPFMWKWVHRLAPENTMPFVDEQFREDVPADKTIAILFITLLDDVLEKLDDRATFTELRKIPDQADRPNPARSSVDSDYVEFALRVWETLERRIRRAPNYEMYEDLFRFDVKQAITAIEYTDLAIKRPDLATVGDLERYESHNMVMFAYADIDLMHTTGDYRSVLPELREAVWTAQQMARIGNWVSTWERELAEGDFSAGPIVAAVEASVVSPDELIDAQADETVANELINRINQAGIPAEFLDQWEANYVQLRGKNGELDGLDLEPYIDGLEEVLRYHLASTGLK